MERHAPPNAGEPDFRALRLKLGLKQKAIADLLDVDQATVSRWESGRTPVDLHLLSRLERIQLPHSSAAMRTPLLDGHETDNPWPNILKFYRATRQITQEQMSDVAGCSPESISRWECGLFKPDLGMQRKLRDLILRPLDDDDMLLSVIKRVEASRAQMNVNLDGYSIAFSGPLRAFSSNARFEANNPNYQTKRFQHVLDMHDGVFHRLHKEYAEAGFREGSVPLANSYLRINENDARKFTTFHVGNAGGLPLSIVIQRPWNFSNSGREHDEHCLHHSDALVG